MTRTSNTPICSLTVALLALVALPAAAQGQDANRRAVVQALKPGQRVRVDLRLVGRLEGTLALRSDTGLSLIQDDAQIHIRLPDVERLWVRGRATGRGALIGGGMGLVAGVIYGLLIGPVACEPVDGGDCTTAEVAAVTGLLGGAGGAVAGAAIGFAVPTWRLRFP